MNLYKNSIGFGLVLSLVIFAVITYFWKSGDINSNLYFPILYGGIITTFNFILGVLSIKFGIKKSVKGFSLLFLGGMILRLFLMLIAVFICLKFLELKGNSFIFSVFIFYFFYLIIEIFYVIYKNK